ncbi:MAG TPA: hypothetical protein VFI60_03135 [Candidatus Acidoferrum sp.]|nr:hypothetical protein [Candidatus Acidoferrum sp.]
MKRAAVGFRVHSGWAAVVAVSLEKGAPVVLERKRKHLVNTFTYTFRQPYHTAEKMPLAEAREFISQVEKEARRLAHRAVQEMQSELENLKIKLASGSLLLASGRPLPSLEKTLASHTLIHTADGELFREAIVQGCERCGLSMQRIRERELLESAGRALHLKPAEVMRRVTELGRPLGSPWSQDEKFATLAAWLALASRGIRLFKEEQKVAKN